MCIKLDAMIKPAGMEWLWGYLLSDANFLPFRRLVENSKAGINQADTYKGHYGAVTGLHFHPLFGSVDFSDLFLTSSVDWTVKLWRSKVSKRNDTYEGGDVNNKQQHG